jgi:hypothetical protein
MMKSVYILIAALFFGFSLSAQSRPIPRGVREADQVEAQIEKNIPPPANTRPTIDSGKLQREADELAALAASIPSEVDQTAKGIFPKNLAEKLKRIEKLAKQLRSELNP